MLNYDVCKDLVRLNIFEASYVAEKDVKEKDVVFKEGNYYYKIDTKGYSKQELLIAIMTKQASYAKKLYDFQVGLFVLGIIAAIFLVLMQF